VDRRDDLVAIRTATINRLLDRLHELDPAEPPTKLRLKHAKYRAAVASLLETHHGVLADLARNELTEVADLSVKVDLIEKNLKGVVSVGAPSLIAVNGCGPLMAAKIMGETAGIVRFTTEAKYARYSGVAPVPNWSGSTMGRVQTIKCGNRQINRALHTIAMMQIRKGGRGEAYYRRRVSEGDSHVQAIRRVKRQVCRAVYYSQIADAATRATLEPEKVLQS
jgi:transposase